MAPRPTASVSPENVLERQSLGTCPDLGQRLLGESGVGPATHAQQAFVKVVREPCPPALLRSPREEHHPLAGVRVLCVGPVGPAALPLAWLPPVTHSSSAQPLRSLLTCLEHRGPQAAPPTAFQFQELHPFLQTPRNEHHRGQGPLALELLHCLAYGSPPLIPVASPTHALFTLGLRKSFCF